MDLATILTTLTTGLLLGLALGGLVGWLWARSRPEPALSAALEQRSADQALVREGLERIQDQVRDLEHARATWQGQLSQQVADMRSTTELLGRETRSLTSALRKPQVRGRWGELHLRRAVELAGMVDRCDFTEQPRHQDGAQRPDLVVHLAGGRCVVVDAKVPLDAFLDATSADDEEERETHLARHARQLRTHVDALAGKAYWRALSESPEFVVMFVPAEAFLVAALEAQGDLLEHAASRRVIVATPTTLIALLRTVAHGWSQETLASRAAEVQRLGRELHERLGTMAGHLDRVGRSLGATVTAYNQAVGSLEGRVLVSARRLGELGVTDEPLAPPRQLDQLPRSLAVPGVASAEPEASEPAAPELAVLDEPGRAARRARGA